MSRFRQAVITTFIIGTLLNLWFLLGAMAGYKYYGIVMPLDASTSQPFALRVEVAIAVVCVVAWWLSRPKVR